MHKLLNAGFGNEARGTFMAEVEKLGNETASTLGTGGRKAGAAEAPRQRRFAKTPTGTANLSRRAGSARYI